MVDQNGNASQQQARQQEEARRQAEERSALFFQNLAQAYAASYNVPIQIPVVNEKGVTEQIVTTPGQLFMDLISAVTDLKMAIDEQTVAVEQNNELTEEALECSEDDEEDEEPPRRRKKGR